MDLLQHWKEIVDQIDGIAIIDRKGYYVYVNKGWEAIMGQRFADVRGKLAEEIVPQTRLREAMETGKPLLTVPIFLNSIKMFSSYYPIRLDGQIAGWAIQIIFGSIDEAHTFSDSISHIISELDYYKNELHSIRAQSFKYSIDDIVGSSQGIQKVKALIRMAANSQSTVLILGETGCGKELVAHSIHTLSQRNAAPFIKVNCAAIPDTLAESEFFGYEQGAFTGASKKGKEGLFEAANTGSLFLDEINQMSYFIQPKFLRVLQEHEVTRVGGSTSIPINVRIIAASNQPLEDLIAKGAFRQDLYYRLNDIRIQIPPLRERLEDIPELVDHSIRLLNHQLGTRVQGAAPEVIKRFQDYHWPGNIRELQNVLELALNIKGGGVLDMESLDSFFESRSSGQMIQRLSPGTLEEKKRELERIMITDAYKRFHGNKKKTAEYLGISRPMLYQRLKEYELAEK